MDEKLREAVTLLRYGKSFMAAFHNSVNRIAKDPMRVAIQTGRNLSYQSIERILTLIEKWDENQSQTVLLSFYKDAHSRIGFVLDLIRITWSHQYKKVAASKIPEDELILPLLGNKSYNSQDIKSHIKDIESKYSRSEAFCIRVVATNHLIQKSAAILDLDVSKVSGDQIRRSIQFPPEFKQAGIAILSYFSQILNKKYPDIDVGITIEQANEKVTLIVDTPEGEKERIEKELLDYGLVLTGEMTPNEFLKDPHDIIALKHKLELAALEVRQTKDLLYSERKQYDARIGSLEDQTRLLRDMLDKDRYSNKELIIALKELSEHTTKSAEKSLQALIDILEKGVSEADKDAVLYELRSIQANDHSLLSKIEELLIKGAIQGAAGNYLYPWLQALSRAFI